jgi:predicted DNA-binding ribbon-helix-helix protein
MHIQSNRRRTRVVTVHVGDTLHQELARLAERDRRSLSNLLSKLAEDRVRSERELDRTTA